MFSKPVWRVAILMVIAAMLLGACSSGAAAPQAAAGGKAPTELKIVFLNQSPKEEPWNTSMIQSIDRVAALAPHGLKITYKYAENIATPDAERVMREYATTGGYQILWAHGVYTDAVEKMRKEFPNLVIVGGGSGFEPKGGNFFWGQQYSHEPAYLLGIIAGMMTKTGTIGAVAAYPYPNVNIPVNGFIEGAKSVRPDVKVKMTYIENWYDPPKGKESALAQISAGADYIFAERFGPFEAAKEKGIFSFGHYVDQNSLAPDVVVSSTIVKWDPVINFVINAWWEHAANGKAYDAPMKEIEFDMKDGGSDIAPFHGFDAKLPQAVKDAVDKAHKAILDGSLVIKKNAAEVKSN
jgi:basic membrane protein A and related proteins